jgi:hypothetical protein
MLAMATAVATATMVLGGSVGFAALMWLVTLVAAQLLYVAMLVFAARLSGRSHGAAWTEGPAQGVFAHQSDLAEKAVKRSAGPKA